MIRRINLIFITKNEKNGFKNAHTTSFYICRLSEDYKNIFNKLIVIGDDFRKQTGWICVFVKR